MTGSVDGMNGWQERKPNAEDEDEDEKNACRGRLAVTDEKLFVYECNVSSMKSVMLLCISFVCKDDEGFHILTRRKHPISQHSKHPSISPHDRVYPIVLGLIGRFRLSKYTERSYRTPRSDAQQEPTTITRRHASESTHRP